MQFSNCYLVCRLDCRYIIQEYLLYFISLWWTFICTCYCRIIQVVDLCQILLTILVIYVCSGSILGRMACCTQHHQMEKCATQT
jgi:hypothetical protein